MIDERLAAIGEYVSADVVVNVRAALLAEIAALRAENAELREAVQSHTVGEEMLRAENAELQRLLALSRKVEAQR